MPELPEVETTRAGISPHIHNKTITRVIVRESRLRWPIDSQLPQILPSQTVHHIQRRGKYILLTLDHGTLIIHLGMSGRLCVIDIHQTAAKHDHVDIEFHHGLALRFTDPRRFGAIVWTEAPIEQHKLIQHLGVEPLTDAFSGEYLKNFAQKRQVAIKTYIMNAQIVVGVGNIYANEALFIAKVHPKRAAKSLSLKRYQVLTTSIKTVLTQAIEQGGTTLKDFRDSQGQPGYFSQSLKVYGRADQPCTHCMAPIKMIRLANRSTFYCGQCQI